jgi:hypothetical protein
LNIASVSRCAGSCGFYSLEKGKRRSKVIGGDLDFSCGQRRWGSKGQNPMRTTGGRVPARRPIEQRRRDSSSRTSKDIEPMASLLRAAATSWAYSACVFAASRLQAASSPNNGFELQGKRQARSDGQEVPTLLGIRSYSRRCSGRQGFGVDLCMHSGSSLKRRE